MVVSLNFPTTSSSTSPTLSSWHWSITCIFSQNYQPGDNCRNFPWLLLPSLCLGLLVIVQVVLVAWWVSRRKFCKIQSLNHSLDIILLRGNLFFSIWHCFLGTPWKYTIFLGRAFSFLANALWIFYNASS